MDSQIGVEKVREADTECFGCEPEELSVPVEAPCTSRFLDREARLISAVKQLVVDLPLVVPVGQRQRLRPVPFGLHYSHRTVG